MARAGEPIGTTWSTDTLTTLEWSERWGEKGWAWSEPRAVEVTLDAFAPEALTGVWHWVDSTGHEQPMDEESAVAKGWQTLKIPAQWTGEEGLEFPGVGSYSLQLRTEQGLVHRGPRVVVEEAE